MSQWCFCLWMAAEACVIPQVWHILWRITTTMTKRSSDVIRVSVFCLCWRRSCVRFVKMTISRLKSTEAQPNFKVLSLSNTTNDLVLFASYSYQFIVHNNWAISCSLIGWWAMVFDLVDHGNEVMMAHFAFLIAQKFWGTLPEMGWTMSMKK